MNTFARFGQKSGCLLAVILPNYVLQCFYVFEGAKYDPSRKIAGSGYDAVICLMEIPECFDKGHHLFTGNIFMTYAAAAYLLKRLIYN